MILFIILFGLSLAAGHLSGVPRAPDQEGGGWEDHNGRRYQDYQDQDHQADHHKDFEKLSPPCKLLIERFKERILRDRARIRVYGNGQNEDLRSAQVT